MSEAGDLNPMFRLPSRPLLAAAPPPSRLMSGQHGSSGRGLSWEVRDGHDLGEDWFAFQHFHSTYDIRLLTSYTDSIYVFMNTSVHVSSIHLKK